MSAIGDGAPDENDNLSVASTRVVARLAAEGLGDRFHRLRRRGESVRSIRYGLRRRRREVRDIGFEPWLRWWRPVEAAPEATSEPVSFAVLVGSGGLPRQVVFAFSECYGIAFALLCGSRRENVWGEGLLARAFALVVSHVFE